MNGHPWAHLAEQKAEALTGYLLWLLLRAGTRGTKVKGTPKNAVIKIMLNVILFSNSE